MKCSQPISSPVSSKIAVAPALDQQVEGPADGRIGRQAAGGVGAAADRADDQFARRPSATRGDGLRAAPASARPRPGRPAIGRARAARLLDHQRLDRPARLRGRASAKLPPVEALAAQRDQQHGADVGMRAELLHDPRGVGVGIAAGKADQVHALVAQRHGDLPGHVMGALDQVGHDQHVADALAAVGPQITFHRRCSHYLIQRIP